MHQIDKDIFFMQAALKEAQKAATIDEIPIGAIIVADDKIIARSYNQVELLRDPTAHAEILAITAAANHFNSKYLANCTLYVTLEPCIMCSGALYWTQIKRIVFGTNNPKRDYQILSPYTFHPRTEVKQNILAKESNELLACFFKRLRKPYIATEQAACSV